MHTLQSTFLVRRWIPVGAAALAATVLLGGGLAWGIARAQSSEEPINACVANNGSVRIVTAADACRNNETPVSWNRQGPAGTKGDPGAPGPQGPEGPKGDTGDVEVTVNLEDGTSAAASVIGYLKIDGIEGEAAGKDHAKEIEVLSWSWGVSNSGSTHVGGGGGTGKAAVQDLSIVKRVDKASPKLMEAALTGNHLDRVVLTVQRGEPSKGGSDYLTISLDEVLVTSVSAGASGGDGAATENVTLNFAKVRVEYRPQLPDGTLGDPVFVDWDVVQDKIP